MYAILFLRNGGIMSKLQKSALFCALLIICCWLFTCCKPVDDEEKLIKQGNDIRLVDGVQVDYDNMFFDDFTGGVSYDSWYIGKQVWGANDNGGVVPANVNYTDEGVLVLSGNGSYYAAGDVSGMGSRKDGTLTGGALISKFVTGPGRYEIKMKVLPRLGACSAFWTYCYDQQTGANHEIDIELPGGKDHSSMISFENVLNTNYITVDMNESQDVNVSTATGSDEVIALNDGQWHTFGFDWYTDPEMVVYHVDGKITAVSNIFVPYAQTRLWLGVWFPNNVGFVGDANFERDAMYVDYVKYIPFLNQPCEQSDPLISNSQVASESEYPLTPVSTAKINKIANGNFEYLADHEEYGYGWSFDRRSFDDNEKAALREKLRPQIEADNPDASSAEITRLLNAEINNVARNTAQEYLCRLGNGFGAQGSYGVCLKDNGRLRQLIDGVYGGFDVNLSFKAMGKGAVTVYFKNATENLLVKTVEIDSESYKTFALNEIAPNGTKEVDIIISAVYNGQLCADEFTLTLN